MQLAESNPKTIVLKAMFLHMSRRRTLRTPGCDLSRRPSTTLVRKKLAGKYRSYEGCSSRRKHKRWGRSQFRSSKWAIYYVIYVLVVNVWGGGWIHIKQRPYYGLMLICLCMVLLALIGNETPILFVTYLFYFVWQYVLKK